MSPVLYALLLWLLVSVAFALFFGAVCRLNELSLGADAAPIAPQNCTIVGKVTRTAAPRSALLGPMRT